MCEVLRSNFSELYPSIKKSIEQASFICVDSEFTGLKVSESERGSLFDCGEERYRKLRKSVQSFSISQIGISTFHEVKDRIRGDYYEVTSYNCFIYPSSFGPVDVRFMVQASSWEFLCKHKFDFNKYVYEGVPFLNEEQEKILKEHVTSQDEGLDRDVDEKLIQEYCSKVAAWLVTSKDENDVLSLTIVEDVSPYFLHSEIRNRFMNVWTQEEDDKIVVQKVAEEERKKLDAELKMEQEEKILDKMLGFTKVFRDMVNSKKPLIGHNNLMDLMLMYDKFHKHLPEQYNNFKADIHSMFPVVLDTKHIVACLRRPLEDTNLFNSTMLSELYKSMDSEKGRFHVLHSPNIVHSNECLRYKSSHVPHEAGYDAFMCGYVFIRMAHLWATRGLKSTETRPFSCHEYFAIMESFTNNINMIRAAVNHINISGPDPESRRPQWLYVKSKTFGSSLKSVELARLFSAYGSVDVRLNSPRHALVAVSNFRCAKDIMKAFNKHQTIYVTKYSVFKHSPVIRGMLWTGFILSGSFCIWTFVSSLKGKTA